MWLIFDFLQKNNKNDVLPAGLKFYRLYFITTRFLSKNGFEKHIDCWGFGCLGQWTATNRGYDRPVHHEDSSFCDVEHYPIKIRHKINRFPREKCLAHKNFHFKKLRLRGLAKKNFHGPLEKNLSWDYSSLLLILDKNFELFPLRLILKLH